MNKFDFKNETEDQIEESLENLNYLLAQNNKSDKAKKKAYKKMADKMNIRLDSTSPVRQKPAGQVKTNLNPFEYKPEKQFPPNNYEAPSFKPRSMIGQNEDTISKVSKPKSVITTVPNNSKNQQLLAKEQNCKGSYLNAQVLKVSIIKFNSL